MCTPCLAGGGKGLDVRKAQRVRLHAGLPLHTLNEPSPSTCHQQGWAQARNVLIASIKFCFSYACTALCVCGPLTASNTVQDFDSPQLKHKKHWNSFTSPFFKQLDAVRAELLQQGSVSMDREIAEQHLKDDLRCHWCHAPIKNMPILKSHIVQCRRTC